MKNRFFTGVINVSKINFKQVTLALLGVLMLQSCARSKLTPIPPQGTILAFGDSLTAGVGVESPQSYPSVLSELSGRQVINAGVSGEVTAEGLERLPEVLEETNPTVLILLEGGNDILRNQDPEATKQNLAAMIELAQASEVEVVLIGVPAKTLLSNVMPLYKELAKEYQLAFEDDLVASLLRQSEYKSDEVHFNEQGYRVMAESIHELLVDEGAL